MNLKPLYYILLLFLTPQICIAQSEDIQTLKTRLIKDAIEDYGFLPRTSRYIETEIDRAGEYLRNLSEAGSWNDVDYSDRDNNWAPLLHLDRMLVMAINYAQPDNTFYKNRNMLAGLINALEYWYEVNPESENWYKNEIAKQFYLNIIGLLLQSDIDDNLLVKIVSDLTADPTMTGSNRTLLATSTIYRGVLENNPEMIRAGVKGVTDQIEITTKEGIQPDFSFHQHGHFIYNGSYGSNFLRESIWLASIVRGTQFAYTAEQISILRNYFLDGTRWMLRGRLFDYNVRGRHVGRPDGLLLYAEVLIPQLEHFMAADPEHRDQYRLAKEMIENGNPQDISGHKHFWRSDYTVQHRKDYFVSLKMCSQRTVGIELNMNAENKLGYWLPYGLTYIYQQGDEYDDIFPVWDWALLPGVTNPHLEIEEFGRGVAYTQQTEFVGGVSDGQYGISVMDFEQQKTSAKKAWFWLDREFIALGTAIKSSHEAPVVTGINQTLLKGEVLVDGKKLQIEQPLKKDLDWLHHNQVGYIFPGSEEINLKAARQQGNIQKIYGLGKDTVYQSEVFSAWFDHGQQPTEDSYQYIVVPGINSTEVADYAKSLPVQILANKSEIQAVRHHELEITGLVFHQKGAFEVHKNLKVQINKPALVLINEADDRIFISDPTTELKEITIIIEHDNKQMTRTIALPGGGMAGRSVMVEIKN